MLNKMDFFSKRKIIFILIAIFIFSGGYFVLGGYGISGPSAAPNRANDGLVGYWNFEEGSGQTISDRSGNGNNGTLGANSSTGKDDPVFTSGYSSVGAGGTALSFDGVDDYVNAGNNASLRPTSITLEAWVYSADFVDSYIIFQDVQSSNEGYFLFIDSSNDKAYFNVGNGTSQLTEATQTALSTSAWHHISGTYDSSTGSIKIYLDGIFQNSGMITGGIQYDISNYPTQFGARWSGTGYPFNGSIDEVRIYNRALSADEIRQHYNQKKPVLEMKFDEGSGQKAYDASFNNNDGWLGGTSSVEASDPAWVTGKEGGALSFDGGDYVDAGNSSLVRITGEITLSAWIKFNAHPSGGVQETVMSKNEAGGYGISANDDNSGRLQTYFYIGGAYKKAGVDLSTISTGVWYHVAATYNGSAVDFYLDGIRKESIVATGSISDVNYNLMIGVNPGVVKEDYFNGFIDSVRIHNYARTQDEVLADYNDGKAAHLGKDSQRDDGLVGYWNMEEGSGQTISDRSGNGNNGTLGANSSAGKDDPVFTSGYSSAGSSGTALSFDGKDDYVDAGNGASLVMGTSQWTIEIWVKTTSTVLNSGVLTTWSGGGGAQRYTFLVNDAVVDGKIKFTVVGTGGNATLRSSVVINDGQWHHIVGVRTSTDIIFFIDGKRDDSVVLSSSVNVSNSANLSFGRGANDLFFFGSIDEVRIYNRALSADEIRQHYNQKKPVLEMKFDEGSGQKAYDASFNNNDGWLGGTSAVETSDPAWVAGKEGSALSFDGTDDLITVTSPTALNNITNSITLESWVYINNYITDGHIFRRGDAAPLKRSYGLFTETNGQFLFSIRRATDDTWLFTNSSTGHPVNSWYHITGTFDGTTAKIYINGVLENSSLYSGAIQSTTDNLYIGGFPGYPTMYLNSKIDSVRVYNYARTQDEVLADYNSGKAAHLGKDSQRDDGLVGYWNFEEGSGQTISDRSGNGNNGTLGANSSIGKDDPVFANGYSSAGSGGTALKFDGKDDYVRVSNNSILKPSNEMTIEAWVKPNILDTNISDQFVYKGHSASPWDSYYLAINTANKLKFNWRNTSETSYSVIHDLTVNTGQWYHVVGVKEGATLKIYVNGTIGTTTTSTTGTIFDSDGSLRIGSDGGPYTLNGSIDEVRIYNRALSADEIRQHYNQKKPVLEMKFDEGSGQKAYDASFNNNDGWLGGTSAVEASDPAWAAGKFGAALSFDGNTDYVSTSKAYSNPAVFTQSMWIKTNTATGGDLMAFCEFSGGCWFTGDSYDRVVYMTNAGKIVFGTFSGSIFSISSSYSYNDNIWHHVSASISSAGMKLYIDGSLVALSSNTESYNISGYWMIGCNELADWPNAPSSDCFSGMIDEPSIYNYARTQDEILADYNDGKAAHLR